MNRKILTEPQSKVGTERSGDPVREHPSPKDPLQQQRTDVIPARTVLRKCDLLVAAGLDAPVDLKTQPFAETWRLVEGKRFREIERELQTKGWNVFYLVPDVRAASIARTPERAIQKALRKICPSAVERGVNMLEVASVQLDSFWGFHRVTVTTKLLHIQESPYLFLTHDEMRERILRVKPPPRPVQLTPGFIGYTRDELHAILAGRTIHGRPLRSRCPRRLRTDCRVANRTCADTVRFSLLKIPTSSDLLCALPA